MDISKIYLDYNSFILEQTKITKKINEKKKLNKNLNTKQQSFFFEDYLSTNQKFRKERNFIINEDRIYILYFSFFSLIL